MLNFLLGPRRRLDSDFEDGWTPLSRYGTNRVKTRGGVQVDEDIALTYAACWCATRIIAETTASLPLFLYKRLANGDRELASSHPVAGMVKATPNQQMGSMAFREGRTAHQVNWGNGFAEIERDPRTREAVALWPIHPARVRATHDNETDNRGRKLLPEFPYIVRNDDGSQVPFKADEMLHVPGCISEDGIWGKGVVAYARESVGFGIATERHGATAFGAGLLPRGFLKLPGLKDKEVRKQFREEWKEIHGHPDSGEVGILPVEGDFIHLSMSHEDSQFLETRKHNVNEIARWYRLPPHMIGDLERATFANIEHMSLEFVTYSLMPWLMRWEEQLALKLLSEDEREEYYFEHQLAGLLRGDLETRFDAYAMALEKGWMCINEVRRLENMPSIGPAGDQYFIQLNMTTVDRMHKGLGPPGVADVKQPSPATAPNEPDGANIVAKDAGVGLVLQDALSRMFTKEMNAALRAAKSKDFDAWLLSFYPKHRQTLLAALTPSLALAGKDAGEVVSRLVDESIAILRSAYDTETPAKFQARLEKWPTARAEETARDILGDRNG